jgi:UDP-N-acetylglucosamine 2-epimerase (non-hydrolysing)
VFDELVRAMPPFGFFDYNKLQQNAYCVLSDSGTLSEESAMLNFAAVLIRTSTERPEALDAGSIVIGGIAQKDVQQALEFSVAMRDKNEEMCIASDYKCEEVSQKVLKIIQSYAKIVNLTVWQKPQVL